MINWLVSIWPQIWPESQQETVFLPLLTPAGDKLFAYRSVSCRRCELSSCSSLCWNERKRGVERQEVMRWCHCHCHVSFGRDTRPTWPWQGGDNVCQTSQTNKNQDLFSSTNNKKRRIQPNSCWNIFREGILKRINVPFKDCSFPIFKRFRLYKSLKIHGDF